jgi:prephenate dehydrogenase
VVIGTGLIGTSIALALRATGTVVWLSVADHAAERLAADLGACVILPDRGRRPPVADVAVIAVPPAAVAPVLADAQRRRLAACYTDVASVKGLPLRAARERWTSPRSRRAPVGPERSAIYRRPVRFYSPSICPAEESSASCVAAVTDLALACGARPVRRPAGQHDQWVALVSHAPHVLAAAMAAQCGTAPPDALALAGPGLRDVTRIAASDAALWTEILTANAAPVRDVLLAIADRLGHAARALAGVRPGASVASAGRPASGLTSRSSSSPRCSRLAGTAWPRSRASGAGPPRATPLCRRSSATHLASWPGSLPPQARLASTSRTSGSSTHPACRPGSWSCRSAPKPPPSCRRRLPRPAGR